jgi:hypothetical protein
MKRLLILSLLAAIPLHSAAQTADSLVAKIVLIGDAGALASDLHHTVVEAVEKTEPMDKKTTVIFLGDNLYRHGLPYEQDAGYMDVRAVLDSQANIASFGPRMVYFIPGNHDWMNSNPGGWDAVLRQQRYLESLNRKNVKFLPQDGCPGPIEIQLGNDIVLVIMDTQWWLHPQAKPGIESDCENKTTDEVLGELKDIVGRNFKKLLIFAGHHPFKSNGIHGGYFTPKQHFFPFTDLRRNLYVPLPILGSIYPISRSVFGSLEDLKYPAYANMIDDIDEVLNEHPNVIHVAGHEHAMEWISDSTKHRNNHIIAGSGCKTSRVSRSRASKFVADSLGWATLEIYKDKTVRCSFRAATSAPPGKVLYSDMVLDYSKLPPEPQPDTTNPLMFSTEYALVPASTQYDSASWIRRLLVGDNYRREWSEPVRLKIFHLNLERGGFKMIGAGGGFQTKSLRLEDKSGRRWNLRTIDKDPQKVLPPGMRRTFARDVVQDFISAAHPYAPLTVAALASAAGINSPQPEFFYVPDNLVLGQYRDLFAKRVCLLEPHDPTVDGSEAKSSAKVINKRISTDDHFVDQKAVLQARLLDMLVGDWDRHLDQWRWGVGDTGKGKLYYPIPRDRDQAFFRSDGLIMKLASFRRLPWMHGFEAELHRFKWLNHSPRDFDRFFLNELTRADWKEGIRRFREIETDSVIHRAVLKMPEQIVAIDGESIERKLRSRRDLLGKKGMRYYRFLSKSVNIHGSNRAETFNVLEVDSGLLVTVHAREPDKDTTRLMYSRVFDPKVTKEIRMYGFNGADRFSVDRNVRTGMRIRMIGGGGVDTFDIAGRAHSHVYDVTTEPNQLLAHRHTRNEFSSDPTVNEFKVQEFNYSFLRVPTLGFGYNPDDGLLAGLGAWRRTYNFRKTPYESDNKITALFAFSRKAFQLKYRGAFIHCLGASDLLINADIQRPALRNFFGFGNDTRQDMDIRFYRARYNMINAQALIQKRLFGIVRMAIGPNYNYYSNDAYSNDEKVLENPGLVGLDSASIYTHKQYLGGTVFLNVNNVNSELFPTRGINWHTELNAWRGIQGDAKPYTELHSDMDIYASLSDPAKLVAVLRFGGGHIFSKDFTFFQAMSVGQNNYLRGFRRNRFSGRSLAYNSVELRAKLFDIKSYVLPGAFGLLGFNDVARVWQDGENSARWHHSYGGGIYFIPFNMFIISAATAFSKEERLFNLTVGTKLNVTF